MQDDYGIDIAGLRKQNILGRNMRLIRKHAGMSQRELSTELAKMGVNLTYGALSRWENGDSKPDAYQLLAWCRVFGVANIQETLFDTDCNARGVGPLLNLRGEELLSEIRLALAACGKYSTGHISKPYGDSKVTWLRVYNQSAAAGTGDFLDDEDFEQVYFPSKSVPKGTDFGVRISGESMEPVYTDGEIAMVQSCRKLSNGDVGIFVYNSNAFIKQYTESIPSQDEMDDFIDSAGVVHKKVILHSFNAAYKDIEISPAGDFTIIGRVLN